MKSRISFCGTRAENTAKTQHLSPFRDSGGGTNLFRPHWERKVQQHGARFNYSGFYGTRPIGVRVVLLRGGARIGAR